MTIIDFIRQFRASTLTPVAFYPYKSFTTDRLFTIEEDKAEESYGDKAEEILKYFNDIKKMVETLPIQSYTFPHKAWDNKIVIKVVTEQKGVFFIGWKDGYWTVGLGRDGDNWVHALKFLKNKFDISGTVYNRGDILDTIKKAFLSSYSHLGAKEATARYQHQETYLNEGSGSPDEYLLDVAKMMHGNTDINTMYSTIVNDLSDD